MLKVAYDPIYAHPLPAGHRFPMLKYELIPAQLIHEGTITKENLFSPELLDEATIACADLAAESGKNSHHQAEAPFDLACEDERNCGYADGYRGGENLQRVHLVDIVNAANAKERHHQKAPAGTEISNVHADDHHADNEQFVVALAPGERLQPAPKGKAKHKHHRGK